MRHKGMMSRAEMDRRYPYQVPIDSEVVRASYAAVMERAASSGACSRTNSIVIDHAWHECFCFEAEEAARQFAEPYGAEVRDARKRINKGNWQIWEEKPQGKPCA